METLQKIKNTQLGLGRGDATYKKFDKSISPWRTRLAQSHRQAKKMGRGKGYRQYLKREI